MVNLGTLGAFVMLNRIKNMEKKLRAKGAVSRKTRVTPEEAGFTSGSDMHWLNYLVEHGKVGKAKDGRVWWKEQTLRMIIHP